MLSKQLFLDYATDLHIALLQAGDEGKDVRLLENKVKNIQLMPKEDIQYNLVQISELAKGTVNIAEAVINGATKSSI